MAELDFWGILDLINTQFPQYVPILYKPGIFDVFVRYAKAKSSGVNPWTPDQLLAELHKTEYYQQTTDAARQNDLLSATDPATWQQRVEKTRRMINDISMELGIKLEGEGLDSPAFSFLVQAAREGWDATEIRYRLLQGSINRTYAGGQVATNMAAVKRMANDYGVPLGDWAVGGYARMLTSGAMDMDGVQGYLIEQAKSLFPGLTAALDQGITVRQYADPYVQLASQETGLNPSDVNLTDQKWMSVLNKIDPKTGQRVSMDLDEALAAFRTDSRWGYDTSGQARQSATQLSEALQQKMGTAA